MRWRTCPPTAASSSRLDILRSCTYRLYVCVIVLGISTKTSQAQRWALNSVLDGPGCVLPAGMSCRVVYRSTTEFVRINVIGHGGTSSVIGAAPEFLAPIAMCACPWSATSVLVVDSGNNRVVEVNVYEASGTLIKVCSSTTHVILLYCDVNCLRPLIFPSRMCFELCGLLCGREKMTQPIVVTTIVLARIPHDPGLGVRPA